MMRAVLRSLRSSRRTLAALAALASGACFNKIELAVAVLTPDGGSPFTGANAATQARASVEGGIAAPLTVPVRSNGAFTLNLDLTGAQRASRLRIEALRDGRVMGSGATPPVFWNRLATSVIPVFVQRSDALVPAPPTVALELPRIAPAAVAINSPFIAVFGGTDAPATVDVLDLFNLGRPANTTVAPYGGALHAVVLDGGRVLLVKGCEARLWNASTNTFVGTGENVPPPERCDMTRSTVVPDPAGGAWLVGGTRMGTPSARVDRVRSNGEWVQGVPMVAARVAPAAVLARDGELLVMGGQSDPAEPALERYRSDGAVPADRRPLRTGNPEVDARTGVALVRVGEVAYALGGARVGAMDLATTDAVLDLQCLDQPGPSCPLLPSTPVLLGTRRRDAQAAVSEGDQVLVVGGTDANGAVEPAERVDGASPRSPTSGGVVGMLGAQGLTLVRAHNGSVLVLGGGQRGVWMFRR